MSGYYLLVGGDARICPAPPSISLELLYEKIATDTVEVVRLVQRGARSIDLWIDEMGKMRDPVRWNRICEPIGQAIAGNMLICAANADGESLPLTRDEALYWRDQIRLWRKHVLPS